MSEQALDVQSAAPYVRRMHKIPQTNVRIPRWLFEQIAVLAERENRSAQNFIETRLRQIAAKEYGPPPRDIEKPRSKK